ncbi:unnamed protein product, partial [Arabidopsis halleri]
KKGFCSNPRATFNFFSKSKSENLIRSGFSFLCVSDYLDVAGRSSLDSRLFL